MIFQERRLTRRARRYDKNLKNPLKLHNGQIDYEDMLDLD